MNYFISVFLCIYLLGERHILTSVNNEHGVNELSDWLLLSIIISSVQVYVQKMKFTSEQL